MRILFVGGPGRSGTSFVAERLGRHAQVAVLKHIELKILCEKNGLQDLFHSLIETYSPNRAVMALNQFRRMAEALIEGSYGQPALTTAAPAEDWRACFATFTDRLLEDGHPAPQTPERFFETARALLHRIAALAAGAGPPENPPNNLAPNNLGEDTIFLEKTPHNLLAIGFLSRLAPGARFLHVMRDPRSIAWSLLAMRWGPDELTTAARWVDSYCRAWIAAEARADRLGLPLIRLHIEEAAAAPVEAGAWLTAQLDLAAHGDLFKGADPLVLNRWAAAADSAERALLDARLGGWVSHFGYDPDQVGRRLSRSIPHSAPPHPATPGPAATRSAPPLAPRTPEPATP